MRSLIIFRLLIRNMYDLQIFVSPEVPVSSLPFSVSQFKTDFSTESQTPEWTLEGTANPYTSEVQKSDNSRYSPADCVGGRVWNYRLGKPPL